MFINVIFTIMILDVSSIYNAKINQKNLNLAWRNHDFFTIRTCIQCSLYWLCTTYDTRIVCGDLHSILITNFLTTISIAYIKANIDAFKMVNFCENAFLIMPKLYILKIFKLVWYFKYEALSSVSISQSVPY